MTRDSELHGKKSALGVLPPTRDVLNKWTVAFLLPRDSFYMDGKLQMGPKAKNANGQGCDTKHLAASRA